MTRRHTITPRRVFFDLETGGLDAAQHPIIQIAAVSFDCSWKELERFEVKLKFAEAEADAEAPQEGALRPRAMGKARGRAGDRSRAIFVFSFASTRRLRRPLAKGLRITSHGSLLITPSFDSEFLWTWHDRLREENDKLFLPADRHSICTLQTALILFDQQPLIERPADYRLGTLCEYFGIPFSVNQAHDALYDCLATAQLYQAMTAADCDEEQSRSAA